MKKHLKHMLAEFGYKVENKPIGKGGFGVVYKATKHSHLYAVKVLNLKKMDDGSKSTDLRRELNTLRSAHHENIIHVYDILQTHHKVFIFMEFASNGDIFNYGFKHKGIKETLACQWFYQISTGLSYLHKKLNTAHRDIKLNNMLLDAKWVAKLADFGFAKKCRNATQINSFCGTQPYHSPQILLLQRYNPFKADSWAMGVSIFIMLHGRYPFDYTDEAKMAEQMESYPQHLRASYTKHLPAEANQLVESLLDPNEAKRASVHSIQESPYLRSKLPH